MRRNGKRKQENGVEQSPVEQKNPETPPPLPSKCFNEKCSTKKVIGRKKKMVKNVVVPPKSFLGWKLRNKQKN